MINYEIIPLNQKDIFDKELDLDILRSDINNLYTIGIETLSQLISYDGELPIKNKNLAIIQIFKFLKYVDQKIHSIEGSDDVISLPQSVLIDHFNRNSYKKFMTILKELKIFTEIPHENGISYNYKKDCGNLVTKRYRLFNEYVKQDVCIVIPVNNNKITYETDKKYNKKLTNTIYEIEIDLESSVREELKDNGSINSLRKRLNTIFSLYEKRWIKKGNNVDRVFHSLSNISKSSRKFLHIRNNKFNNIDVVNCQPLLLCYFLKKNNYNIDQAYIDDCETGRLYEKFMIPGHTYKDTEIIKKGDFIVGKRINEITIPIEMNDKQKDEVRTSIKRLLYKSIYFDFKSNTDIALKFKEFYPQIYSELMIIDINKGDKKMAYLLQNIEAEIFNDLIPKKSKYYFTLFDAIYFNSIEDTGELIIELTKKFHKMGLVPRFKINE